MRYLSLDAPRVSQDAALELMVHHLQLAHMLFQATIEDVAAKRREAMRLFTEAQDEDAPEVVAGMEWLARMEEIYEEMKREQGE